VTIQSSNLPNEQKYGKDFKVPELPQILQEHLFGGSQKQLPEVPT
jgi:hypothetical protein